MFRSVIGWTKVRLPFAENDGDSPHSPPRRRRAFSPWAGEAGITIRPGFEENPMPPTEKTIRSPSGVHVGCATVQPSCVTRTGSPAGPRSFEIGMTQMSLAKALVERTNASDRPSGETVGQMSEPRDASVGGRKSGVIRPVAAETLRSVSRDSSAVRPDTTSDSPSGDQEIPELKTRASATAFSSPPSAGITARTDRFPFG